MSTDSSADPVVFAVIRNRLVAITEEMRVALQSVSGSPTVTEASDFFTGLFTPDGAVASMGFQVAFQAPVCGALIRHINGRDEIAVRDGDMFIGNDPYIGALHQNDVQLVGPIFAGDRIVAWAGVEAHETDVGGMDFASWSPKAREVWQEGIRIPCVKLVDRGETRDDVMEMILTASRLPAQLGLDIRAFIATLNVARSRLTELVERYGPDTVQNAVARMIGNSETRMRARLAELPDGIIRAADFLEHDGHDNVLYKLDVVMEKKGDSLILDYSGSSKQAPGFINCTRSGLTGAVYGSVLCTLAWDMQWNEGALIPVEIRAPDGLICTATFPAPVGSATVEALWVTANATILGLNRLLSAAPRYRHRAQGINAGTMATFNMGGVNQYGEPFGLHLMDPIAAGGGAWGSKDGANGGGPITSPISAIADVEKNELAAPLFYFHRRLARDTGGAGKYRGGVTSEVALTLGGIESASALVMTHGAEVPNGIGLAGAWPGSTVDQRMGFGAVEAGRRTDGDWQAFGPKPGLMKMTNRDCFAVTWQGGGGWGDPIERDLDAVADDVARDLVSVDQAREVYGAVFRDGALDRDASAALRREIRQQRIGKAPAATDYAPPSGTLHQPLGEALHLVKADNGWQVISPAGVVLASGSTNWRAGAHAVRLDAPPASLPIRLHDELAITCFYCPASGTLLALDIHRKDEAPPDDLDLDLASVERLLIE